MYTNTYMSKTKIENVEAVVEILGLSAVEHPLTRELRYYLKAEDIEKIVDVIVNQSDTESVVSFCLRNEYGELETISNSKSYGCNTYISEDGTVVTDWTDTCINLAEIIALMLNVMLTKEEATEEAHSDSLPLRSGERVVVVSVGLQTRLGYLLDSEDIGDDTLDAMDEARKGDVFPVIVHDDLCNAWRIGVRFLEDAADSVSLSLLDDDYDDLLAFLTDGAEGKRRSMRRCMDANVRVEWLEKID